MRSDRTVTGNPFHSLNGSFVKPVTFDNVVKKPPNAGLLSVLLEAQTLAA
jgi:hypothetical protein